MAVTIGAAGEVFDLESTITFSGTAESPATAVSLTADDTINLGVARIEDGKWSFARAFQSPGHRKITASAIDNDKNIIATAVVRVVLRTRPDGCELRKEVFKVGVRSVYSLPASTALFYVSGMAVDADGSPHAYHPDSKSGLDDLQNAMDKNGRFVGVVTRAGGAPVIQKSGDPAPGFYVSPTSLADPNIADRTNPLRYVNSEAVPYVVVSGAAPMRSRVALGDAAAVYYGKSGKLAFAMCADMGPTSKLGEGSIALANKLGIHPSARIGGAEDGVLYVLFPRSRSLIGKPWTHLEPQSVVDEQAHRQFEEWGGLARAKACFADLI